MPVLFREFVELAENLPSFIEKARETLTPYLEKLDKRFPNQDIVDVTFSSLTAYSSNIVEKLGAVFGSFLSKGYSVGLAVVNLALLPFIVWYLAIDFPSLRSKMLDCFPNRYQKKTAEILSEINVYIAAFVRGQLIVCTVLFILYACGLGFVGA